jgi:hypothetical protein
MPFSIDSDESGRFVVQVVSEPEFIHGLWMSPAKREPFLNVGDWVVLAFAIWNSHDRPAIASAIDAVKEMDGRVRLGIRPFEVAEEFSTWSNAAPDDADFVNVRQNDNGTNLSISITPVAGSTPLWLVFRNGGIVHSHSGLLSVPEIRAMIARYLP